MKLILLPPYHEGWKSFRKKNATKEDSMMEREVAKPLRILSAYFMTMATAMPPRACMEKEVSTID